MKKTINLACICVFVALCTSCVKVIDSDLHYGPPPVDGYLDCERESNDS